MASDKQLIESELLVVRWQRGDRSAFEDIVKLWEKPLFYYLRRLTASEADAWELLQETWLKLVRSLDSLRDTRTLPSFLYTTARNTAVSRIRQLRPEENSPFPENVPDDSVEENLASFDQADQVHHALDQLSVPQREVLTLFFLQDLTLEQMATLLNAPLGTVKSRLFYAKQAIRSILSHNNQPASQKGGNLKESPEETRRAKGGEHVR